MGVNRMSFSLNQNLITTLLACLHDQNKSGFFWMPGFCPANQSKLKSIQKI